MLQRINGGRADDTRDRHLQACLRHDLLIPDDFGLRPLQLPGPADHYDVIDGCYACHSILLTSNCAPNKCLELFGNLLLASTGLDRLPYHAEIMVIAASSFRAQERQQLEQERDVA